MAPIGRLILIALIMGIMLPTSARAQLSDQQDSQTELDEAMHEVDRNLTKLDSKLNRFMAETRAVDLSGDLRVDLSHTTGEPNSFGAIVHLIPEWHINDEMEVWIDASLYFRRSWPSAALSFAEFRYHVNDSLTVKAGLLVTPFGYFRRELFRESKHHFTSEPLAVTDGLLVPAASLGTQLGGLIQLPEQAKLHYALYVSNGPSLHDGYTGPQTYYNHHGVPIIKESGGLLFKRTTDNNDNLALGGHLAYAPMLELEFGVSALVARVGDDESDLADTWARIFGAHLAGDSSLAGVHLQGRSELIYLQTDNLDYGLGATDNIQYGYYIEIAARPEGREDFMGNLAVALRYESLVMPEHFSQVTSQTRIAAGIEYWLAEQVLIKLDYTHGKDDTEAATDTTHRLAVALAAGF